MRAIYEILNKCNDADYNVISEEYKVLNNLEYFYIGVKLTIEKHSRIGYAKMNITEEDYKSKAIDLALNRAYLYMTTNNDKSNNNTNGNNINNNTNMNNGSSNNSNYSNYNNNRNNVNYNNNGNANYSNNNNNMNNNNNNNQNKVVYSQQTLARMKEMKSKNDITDNEKLLQYFKAWNKNIKSIKNLSEQTVVAFLDWMDNSTWNNIR